MWKKSVSEIIVGLFQKFRLLLIRTKSMKQTLSKQDYKCGICNSIFHVEDTIDIYHLKDFKKGGKMIARNLSAVYS